MSLSGEYRPFARIIIDEPGKPLRHYRVELGDAFYGHVIAFAEQRDEDERRLSDWQAGGILPTSLGG